MSFKPGFWFSTSGDHLVQRLAERRFGYRRLLGAVSSRALTALREGDSTTSLGNILQHSITFIVWVGFFLSPTRISCILVCAQTHFSCTFLNDTLGKSPYEISI